MAVVIGIDVAGTKKGFAVAAYELSQQKWLELRQVQTVAEVVNMLVRMSNIQCIAIDCPPKAVIAGPETRSAERQLNKAGYKMQWTRRSHKGLKPQEWMENGQLLWEALGAKYDGKLIETFPTVACDGAASCDMKIPLYAFAARKTRVHYKDLIDAALCAWVAQKAHLGQATKIGHDDELGAIYY